MKNIRKILLCSAVFLLLIIISIYLIFLFVLPALFNSEANIKKAENYFCTNKNVCVITNKFNLDTTPDFHIKLKSEDINIQNIVSAKNLSGDIDLKSLASGKISADYIRVNGDGIQKLLPAQTHSKNLNFDFNTLPAIDIKNFEFVRQNVRITAKDVKFNNRNAYFKAKVKTPFLLNPIFVDAKLLVDDNTLFSNHSKIFVDRSKIYLTGKLTDKYKRYDFRVKGKNLPVYDIEKALLYYQKSQDPAKKFIENFVNYAGKIDVDLNIRNSGIYGKCTAKNLSANAVWFDIPVYFKNAVFNFSGKNVTSIAQGLLAGEKVVHTLKITNLGSPEKEVIGTVNTTFHDKFKYVPHFTILNSADVKLIYCIKNKKIDIVYLLNVNEGSDLFYKGAYLGLLDKKRRFMLHTYKDSNNLYIKKYEYSLIDGQSVKNIISGDGLLIKQYGHMTPRYLTYKTNGYAPVSVIGPLGKYVKGGAFSGDLKYDFIENQVSGSFELINSIFKNFYVKTAKITAIGKKVYIKALGKYDNENFSCYIDANNEFDKSILIYNMKLFLDKLILKQKTAKNFKFTTDKTEIASKIKDADITIENWEIKLNQIKKDRIVLNNIKLLGSLKEDIFRFSMPELEFAHGILSATGRYNFANNSSCIDFKAKNINSNMVGDILFNLPDQVEGIADANLHLDTFDNLENIKAAASFEVKEGFLPKLGNTEFMVKKSRKFKVSDIVNVDFTQKKLLQSDIKGSFVVNNSKLENIVITSQQQFLSILAEGSYDSESRYADMNIYGKYNQEAPKGIKILFIPLNWVLKVVFRPEKSMCLYREKLNRIPAIKAGAHEKYFRVKMSGNLNSDNIDVEIKSIK